MTISALSRYAQRVNISNRQRHFWTALDLSSGLGPGLHSG